MGAGGGAVVGAAVVGAGVVVGGAAVSFGPTHPAKIATIINPAIKRVLFFICSLLYISLIFLLPIKGFEHIFATKAGKN
jgi:hypothetical protein